MAENKVSIELTIEDVAAMKSLENFSKKINRATKDTTEFGKGADAAFKTGGDSASNMFSSIEKGASSGFGEIAKGVTIANLASQAIMGVAGQIQNFVNESINGAIENEQALKKLEQALRATSGYSDQAMVSFKGFADELEQASKHTGPQILEQIALAKTMGATNEEAKELTQAAANLSATFGGSLEQASRQLAQTLNGDLGKLGKLVPELKNLSTEQLRAGDALAIVNAKLNGAAAAEVDSYSGRIDGVSKAYGKLQEELGNFIIKSNSSKGIMESIATIFQDAAQKVADFRIELDRTNNGFIENEESLNQLSREYENLTQKIEALEKRDAIMPGGLDSFDTSKLKIYRKELEELEKQVQNASIEVKVSAMKSGEMGEVEKPREVDQKTIDNRKAMYASLQQIQLEQAAWEAEQDLLKREITDENFAVELEQYQAIEQEKINAKYMAEEEKNKIIEDSEARRLATEAAAQKKSLDIQKSNIEAENKLKQQQIIANNIWATNMSAAVGVAANAMTVFMKDGTKEMFYAQKAAALAQAIVSMYTGIANALLLPPAAVPLAVANAKATGAIAISGIVASTIKGFAVGGIVDSSSRVGDKNLIRVNGGEAVLTEAQQSRFMDYMNGSRNPDGGNLTELIRELISEIRSQPIIVSIDEREIARSVRNQKEMGYAL